MRLPVAAKIALKTAGATTGTPGSPTPVGGSLLGTTCTSTTGISSMRSISYSSKLASLTRPFSMVIPDFSAAVSPNTTALSICAAMMPGLTARPQSTAQTMRGGGQLVDEALDHEGVERAVDRAPPAARHDRFRRGVLDAHVRDGVRQVTGAAELIRFGMGGGGIVERLDRRRHEPVVPGDD